MRILKKLEYGCTGISNKQRNKQISKETNKNKNKQTNKKIKKEKEGG